MDISTDQYKPEDSPSGPFSAVSQVINSLFKWLTGFFTLSDEDRSKAGIYRGGEGRD